MHKRGILTFLRFIFPYVLILIAVAGLEEIMYRKSEETLTRETAQVQLAMLENSQQAVDNMLKNARNKAVEFSLSPKYRAALFLADNAPDHFYSYVETWETFRDAHVSTDYLLDFVLYFREMDFLINSQNLSTDPEQYYRDLMKYGDLNYDQWLELLGQASRQGRFYPAVPVLINGRQEVVIPYMRLLPFDFQTPKAVLQIYILESAVEDVFGAYVLENQGTVLIVNGQQEIITCQGSRSPEEIRTVLPDFSESSDFIYLEPETGSRWGDFLVYVRSQESDWTYISILPEKIVMSQVNHVKQTVHMLTVLGVLTILSIGLLATTRNVTALQNITRRLQGFGNHGKHMADDYSVIKSNLNSLLESHDRLSTNFQKQAGRVVNNVVLELIQGKYSNKEDTVEVLEELGFQIRRENYCVAVFKIAYLEDYQSQKQVIRSILETSSNSDVLTASYAIDRVLVLFFGDGEQEAFEKKSAGLLQDAAARIRDQGIEGFCVMGTTVHTLEEIYRSTGSAVKAAMNIFYNGSNRVYFCDKMYSNYADVFYSSEKEQKIINLVRQGDCGELQKFLDEIIAKRSSDENNALRMKGFYMQLLGTLNKVDDEHRDDTEFYEKLEDTREESEMADCIRQEYLRVARKYGERKENRGNDVVLLIKDYITENYQNSLLCLAEIADKYSISEVYFSQTFKAVTGENFSVYLEHIRMEKARQLLQSTDMTVEDIAYAVGYNSVNTFHKAFKRVNGVTPGGYKKIHSHPM